MKAKFHCGLQIKKIRLANNITQTQLGEKIGKTQALVSYIEKTGNVNEDVLQEIAKALNVNIEQLITPTDEAALQQFNKSINKDALYKQLISEISYLKSLIEDYKETIKILSSIINRK